jgi:vitamin B12 transporter
MYKMLLVLVAVAVIPLAPVSSAEAARSVVLDEVIVTAARMEELASETTSSVTIINAYEIRQANVEYVADLLRMVPELNLVQNGSRGKTARVLLRGASSQQTLVMIDGIKVKSTTLGYFDFSGIRVEDIRRIEIVKGPQSAMYGSESMGGVINIITKKGGGEESGVNLSYEYGAYHTSSPTLSFSGGDEAFNYRLSGSYYRTDGISSIRGGVEKDGYKNETVSGKLGLLTARNVELEISGNYYFDRNELDGYSTDDPNRTQNGHHYVVSGKGTFYLADNWEQILTVSRAWDSLRTWDPDNPSSESDIESKIKTVELQNNTYVSDAYTMTAGVEYRKENGINLGVFDRAVENRAMYLNNKVKSDEFTFNFGMRYDEHETFGSETTYRVGVLQDMEGAGMRARMSYATGFRAPTMNDLFYQGAWGSGNPDLKPERSDSWEFGIEQDMSTATVFTATYFEQNYTDLIQWVYDGSLYPDNVAEARVKGVETSVKYRAGFTWFKAGYTYLDTEDKSTGQWLSRRPRDKFSASLNLRRGRLRMVVDYMNVGKRYDSVVDRDLERYDLVNLSGTYGLTENIKLFARVENLFNEDYEEAGGFGVPGSSLYSGIKAGF